MIAWGLALGNVLEPAAQRYEEEEHGGRVEEGHGRGVLHHDHAGEDHAHAVHVGDGGGQHHQHVHVGGSVPQRRARLHKMLIVCQIVKKSVVRIHDILVWIRPQPKKN